MEYLIEMAYKKKKPPILSATYEIPWISGVKPCLWQLNIRLSTYQQCFIHYDAAPSQRIKDREAKRSASDDAEISRPKRARNE